MKTKIYILTLLVLLVSCKKYDSSEITQTDIKQHYTVKYYKANNSTTVFAYFTKGGINRVYLSSPSAISYNGVDLGYNQFAQSYTTTFGGDVSNGQFTYKNNSAQQYINNTVALQPIGFGSNFNMFIDQTSPFSIGLGISQHSNDGSTIRLNFANKNFYAQNSFNGYTISISSADLQEISKGFYIGNFIRSRQINLQQSTGAGGTITQEYIGENMNIQIY
jgi:hypothetical protein